MATSYFIRKFTPTKITCHIFAPQILLHIGALSDKSKFYLAETADHGGPLGELVQWSDLISIIHLLGHRIVFITEVNALQNILPHPSSSKTGGCPTGREKDFSVIFTDIVGFKQFKKAMRSQIQHHLWVWNQCCRNSVAYRYIQQFYWLQCYRGYNGVSES